MLFWTERVLDISIEYILSCLHQHERLATQVVSQVADRKNTEFNFIDIKVHT